MILVNVWNDPCVPPLVNELDVIDLVRQNILQWRKNEFRIIMLMSLKSRVLIL